MNRYEEKRIRLVDMNHAIKQFIMVDFIDFSHDCYYFFQSIEQYFFLYQQSNH